MHRLARPPARRLPCRWAWALAALLCALPAWAGIDANDATEAELDSVRGIGPGTSRAILQERRKGAFRDWDDLVARVPGLGERRAQRLSDEGLTVRGQPLPPGRTPAARKE